MECCVKWSCVYTYTYIYYTDCCMSITHIWVRIPNTRLSFSKQSAYYYHYFFFSFYSIKITTIIIIVVVTIKT